MFINKRVNARIECLGLIMTENITLFGSLFNTVGSHNMVRTKSCKVSKPPS